MSGNQKSTLAKNTNYHLNISIKKEACPLSLAPMSSTTATLVMGDAIAVVLMKLRDFKDENFAKDVLKKYKNDELKKEAFKIYAKNASINEILKYDYEIDKEIIKAHLKDENVKLLLQKAKLLPSEEIEIAKEIHQSLDPDKEFEIIKPLKWASAYLAFKYEHIQKAKEIIEENELKFFKYFLKLKEAGVKADIDEYIDSRI